MFKAFDMFNKNWNWKDKWKKRPERRRIGNQRCEGIWLLPDRDQSSYLKHRVNQWKHWYVFKQLFSLPLHLILQTICYAIMPTRLTVSTKIQTSPQFIIPREGHSSCGQMAVSWCFMTLIKHFQSEHAGGVQILKIASGTFRLKNDT